MGCRGAALGAVFSVVTAPAPCRRSRSSGGRLAQEWGASPSPRSAAAAAAAEPVTHQRDVIVHRDNTGYGFTVSGDTPVSVLSVKLGETGGTDGGRGEPGRWGGCPLGEPGRRGGRPVEN